MKTILLGTSDVWLTSHSAQQSWVLYCRLSDFQSNYNDIRQKTQDKNFFYKNDKNRSQKAKPEDLWKRKKIAKTDLCNKEQEEREGTLGQPAATKKPNNIAGG